MATDAIEVESLPHIARRESDPLTKFPLFPPQYPGVALADAPTDAYRQAGNQAARALKGGAINGNLVNGIGFAAGNVGQAFNLDGVGGHVRVADQPNLRLTNALTVEAWINPASIGDPRSIVSKWDGVIGPEPAQLRPRLQSDGSANMLLSPNGRPRAMLRCSAAMPCH